MEYTQFPFTYIHSPAWTALSTPVYHLKLSLFLQGQAQSRSLDAAFPDPATQTPVLSVNLLLVVA